MNVLIRGGLELPLHYLFYIDDFESYDGLDDRAFDYLAEKYPKAIESVRAAVAWAAKNPDYDYNSLWSDYPFDNDQIYFYLRRYHETLEEIIRDRDHTFTVQFDEPVVYLDEIEQLTLRAEINDGLLMGMKGLVDTTQSFRLFNGRGSGGLYVMRGDGELFVAPYAARGVWYHSVLARGEAMICAGFMNVEEGKILTIDRRSGHYQTTPLMLKNALEVLADKGVDVGSIEVVGL